MAGAGVSAGLAEVAEAVPRVTVTNVVTASHAAMVDEATKQD